MTDAKARLELVENRVKSLGPDLLIAYLLWLGFGIVSGHRFYLKKPGTALVQIISYIFVVGLAWWIIDGVRLPMMVAERRASMRKALLASPDLGVSPGAIEAIGVNGRMTLEGGNLVISRKSLGLHRRLITFVWMGVQGDKTIPIRQITAIQLSEPTYFINGYFRLSINGRDPVGGVRQALRDENAILLEPRHLEPFKALRQALQSQLDAIQAPMTEPHPAGIASQADEIEKMAKLHDRGVLTDAEFAAKKQQILGS